MKSQLQPELTEKKVNQATTRRVGQAHGRRGGRFEAGAVMPMTIVALVVLIGIAGLVVDFAPVFLDKNKLQHAVDAAALAGAEYLRAHEPVTGSVEATAKEVAVSVFNKQKPESAPDVTVADVGIDGDKVTLSVSTAHATSFLRVLPGAMTNIPVGASSEAGQVKSNVGNICLSPLVICTSPGNRLAATTPNYTKFDVGVNALVLCGKGESNCTSTIDNKLAQATNQELSAAGNCEFTLPGKIARGRATGQVRAGINSRFFDCGRTLPRGYPNCLAGYPRDNYSWIGRDMRTGSENSASQYGSLAYSEYIANQKTTAYKDVFGNATTNNTAANRRMLYIAEVDSSACAKAEITVDDYKLWCAFLRKPAGTSDNMGIWLEILDPNTVDCEDLAKAPGGTSSKETTRTLK